MQNAQTEFENLPIPRKGLSILGSRYRVYSDAQSFTVVDATTALEALKSSGLKTAYKIMREDPMGENLVQSDAWLGENTADETIETAAVVAEDPTPSSPAS